MPTPTSSKIPTNSETPPIIPILIGINIVVLLLYFQAMIWVSEVGPLILLFYPIFAITLSTLAVLNIFFFSKFVFKQHAKGFLRLFSIGMLLLSVGWLVLFVSNKVIHEYKKAKANIPISREAAIDLINDCKVRSIDRGMNIGKDYTRLDLKDESISYDAKALDTDFDALRVAAAAAEAHCGRIRVTDIHDLNNQ